ncbi:MAG: hypothetical protein JSS78_01370 [Bacteroidetes bacterium]|nr:hypothetical protein [Bacteroidota bacterium]
MSEQNTNMQPAQRKNNAIFVGIILLLIGIIVYLFVSRNNLQQQTNQVSSQLDTVTHDRDNIRNEYDAAIARLDQLVGKNAQLDSIVANQNSEIGHLRSQIQKILTNSRATEADYARARSMVAQLKGKVKTYEERIAELEADNTRLNKYNQVLIDERDSTVTKNIALSQKVRLGSVLHVSNIRMTPIQLRRNGTKEKETSKASKVDIFRITFDIDENRVTEDGVKDLFVRIVAPSGALLSNDAFGSGSTDTYDGASLNYTIAKQVNLKQGEPVNDVVVDWHQDGNYERGTYKIEIYNSGYKIGSGTIDLR